MSHIKSIINKGNKTEEQAIESKQVLLWGLNKVNTKLMKKAEAEFKPTKRAYTKKEGVIEKVKVQVYDPSNEYYTDDDIPFLNKEYKRISDIVDNPKTDDEYEEAVELQDKLYDLIDQLESVSDFRKKTEGSGFNENVLKHLVSHIVDKNEPIDKRDFKQAKQAIDTIKKIKDSSFDKSNERPIKGGAIVKGSPEALARAEKMRLGKEAKRIAEGKPPPKGKYVKKVKDLKPYYNIGDIPTGFREAKEEEAIENNKLSHWGKYQVNPETMKTFKNVGFFFNKDLTEKDAMTLIGRMITRMKGALRDIPWVNSRLENIQDKGENSKYFKKKSEVEEEGIQLKNRYKSASKMIDILSNHIKSTNPSFMGVIKPKQEIKNEELREMKISEKTPEIEIKIEKDFRIPKHITPVIKEKKIIKSKLMDSFTHMTKEGKNVDIETKIHIHKDKINPQIKGAMRESLLNEFDREIKGHGLNDLKHPKIISTNNRYNEMDHHASIDHHLKGLLHHLGKAGIKGTGIKHAFKKLGSEIKSAGENANSALSKTNTYQALAKGKNMSMGDLGNSISGDASHGFAQAKQAMPSKMGMGVRRGKISLSDSDSDSDSEMHTMGGMGMGKGSKAMKDKMARIRAMKKC